MTRATPARWLLIGNSRWHWAERTEDGGFRGWDEAPSGRRAAGPPPLAWAAVGPPPDPLDCPPERQVGLADVPLLGCPPWLGVDRALAGWGAWRTQRDSVLVADAGTVLSLTRVDGSGTFRGGRLLAGLRLQLEAMTNHTTLIPAVLGTPQKQEGNGEGAGDPDWPQATAAAMRVGVEAALAAAVVAAGVEAGCPHLVFTGGDGPWLHRRLASTLARLGLTVSLQPLLCLESLARLRPAP